VRGIAQVFVAGPPVVARLGENVDKEALGGAAIHGRNGVADDVVSDEKEAFERTHRFLSYLPSSVWDAPPRGVREDPLRREEWLIDAIPRDRRTPYDARALTEAIFDRDSFFEIGRGYGRSAITGLARLDGWPVAVLASDPKHYAGGWTSEASQKVTRHIDLADTFHLPVVHLVDQPGFVIGTAAEKAATIRHGARAMAAIYQARVPWCSVILRKVYGVAGAAHQNHGRLSYRFAWPSGDWGSLPIEGGLEAAYKSLLADADDPEALKREIEEKLNAVRSPFRTAEAFMIEEIIDPRDTRRLLCEFAELAAPLRGTGDTGRPMRP
jgi:acetyl-CoA carboxylase carboxyltransferase component